MDILTNNLGSGNTGLILTNALLPIASSIIILLLDHLLKSRLKRRKNNIWINFLKYDKYIRECIQKYKKIESPKLEVQLIAEVLGIILSFFIYLGLLMILPFAFSTLSVFLIAFISTLIISLRIDKLKKNQKPLKESEQIAKVILFLYWFIITGILDAPFPYILTHTYPTLQDIRIFGLSLIFLLLDIYYLFSKRRDLLNYVGDLLNKQYFKQYVETFPKVRIKTKSTVLEGKVFDVFNDNMIILDDYGVKKAVEWDSITYMELKR